jgi:hypothetical protein
MVEKSASARNNKRNDCLVCRGQQCKGGGNTRCLQRDPHASHLAGILDTYGGLRFIVAHRNSFKHHVRHDELLIVVPNLVVHEPIAWNDIPIVVERITLTVNDWIERNHPNEFFAQEAIKMYRIRRLEGQFARSLDLGAIVET